VWPLLWRHLPGPVGPVEGVSGCTLRGVASEIVMGASSWLSCGGVGLFFGAVAPLMSTSILLVLLVC